jgi:hypothetical protein
MNTTNTFSKSDYLLGLKCPLALWYAKYRRDLREKLSDRPRIIQGHQVGDLARERFPKGVLIENPWELEAAERTAECVRNRRKYIYEAVARLKTGELCAADILCRNADGSHDIIEVKSSSMVKEYYILDVSFQRYVFRKAGYKIRKCHVMTLNTAYVRQGELDLKKLFTLHDVTSKLNSLAEVGRNIVALRAMLAGKEPKCSIGAACGAFFSCNFQEHCWRGIPEYSVFTILNGKQLPQAEALYQKHKTADPRKLAPFLSLKGTKKSDLESFLKKKRVRDPEQLRSFLSVLEYPLYFLDYETVGPPVPLFDGTKPYQAIPFQFSLHIVDKPGAKLRHVEYLHAQRTDPRPRLVKALITACGKRGSVVVYNAGFEKGCNDALALAFPEHESALGAINERVVDLFVPFRRRHLYSCKQQGSASLKKVLPAFTDLSYTGNIREGEVASSIYLAFMTDEHSKEEASKMFTDLRVYCGQDTMAMVELLKVVQEQAAS